MLAGTLAFALGIFFLLQFPFLPPFYWALLLPLVIILCRYFYHFRWPFFVLLGFFWAYFRLDTVTDTVFDKFIADNDLYISGTILSPPERYPNHLRIKFRADSFHLLDSPIASEVKIIRLSWYRTDRVPVPGETWQFKVRLKRPYSFMNPGGFDYEAWLYRKNIALLGYIKEDPFNKRLSASTGFWVERLRYRISSDINQLLDAPLRGFALALTLGDRSQLSIEERDKLGKTGTNHLIAISGLHLSLVAGVVYFLVRVLFGRIYFFTQCIAAPQAAAIAAFIAALVYAALAGFTLPTQRALIMIGAFFIALLYNKRFPVSNIIAIAVIIILLLDPMAIISIDFCLSFMAVVFILYLSRFRYSSENPILKWGKLQVCLSLALLPLLIFWFNQAPVFSAVVNLFAIPLVGFIIIPLLLVSALFLFIQPAISVLLYGFTDIFNSYYWDFLTWFSEHERSLIAVAASNNLNLLLAIIGVFILLMPKGLPGRFLGVLWLLPLLFPVLNRPKQGEFEFTLLDVGQGLAAVIQTESNALVYDTGAKFSDRFNIGDAVITPYLKSKGITSLSHLIVSHGDNDHIGGAAALTQNFQIDNIISSVPDKFDTQISQNCYAGKAWTMDGVVFRFLHPSRAGKYSGNNGSCVLKISNKTGSVLLTGDIEKQAENMLVTQYGSNLKSNLLIAPHHGSKTSSSVAFLKNVDPDYVFFPVGYRNRFGFPNQDIIKRYHAFGIDSYMTYKSGALTVRFAQDKYNISEYRHDHRRFWHYKSDN